MTRSAGERPARDADIIAHQEPDESQVTEPESGDSNQVEPPMPVLSQAARRQAIEVAAATLPAIRSDELPSSLRRFVRFTPAKRSRLAAGPLAAELATNAKFRRQVAGLVRDAGVPMAEAVWSGNVPAAADPAEIAGLAYVLRPENWRDLVDAANQTAQSDAEAAEIDGRIADAQQRAANAEHDRTIAERESEKLRVELTEMRTEMTELRRSNRLLTKNLRDMTHREQKARDALAAERGRLKRAETDHQLELRKLRARLDESKLELDRAREGARDTRALNDSRVWLLLETISGAAQGLRRELSLEPAEHNPADFVADDECATPGQLTGSRARGLSANDPARLDQLLALPQSHLIVDGYNVTMLGYGELSLEQQRNRLVKGISGLAAQTGTEVTVVFDGADRVSALPPSPRGVRVLFSRKGQTADEVIRKLARAEPDGRPVIVISSDKEVADGTRRHGAYPLSSEVLLKRLNRA